MISLFPALHKRRHLLRQLIARKTVYVGINIVDDGGGGQSCPRGVINALHQAGDNGFELWLTSGATHL